MLAKLAGLRSLWLPELQLLPGSSTGVSSSLKELHLDDAMGGGLLLVPQLDRVHDRVQGDQVPAGLLPRLMPSLEVFKAQAELCMCSQDALRLLQGHSRLRNCSVSCGLYGQKGWPEGLLGSLVNLEELQLYGLAEADVDATLHYIIVRYS